MKIRHERPMSDMAFPVRAPLRLTDAIGRSWSVGCWTLSGLMIEGAADLPRQAQLTIPFQSADVSFTVTLGDTDENGWVIFSGLTGPQRETLALFYRNLLSGRMEATADIITSLDTPVDLVPMGETDDEKAATATRRAPRAVRIAGRLLQYAALAGIVFGVLGNQVWKRIDNVDIQHGRVVAPMLQQTAPGNATVADLRVAVGQSVARGQLLVAFRTPGQDADLKAAQADLFAAEAELARVEAALNEIRATVADTEASMARRFAVAAMARSEFLKNDSLDEARELWLTMRTEDPAAADSLRPDAITERQIAALVDERAADVARAQAALDTLTSEARALDLRAPADGVVRQLYVADEDFLRAGTPVLDLETDAPRVAIGWASPTMAETLFVGMPAEMGFNVNGHRQKLQGEVVNLTTGENPTRQGEFGIIVTVAVDGMDVAETRETLRPGAPVALNAEKQLGTRMLAGAEGLAQSVGWTLDRVLPDRVWPMPFGTGQDTRIVVHMPTTDR
ncbi:HlyD family secretion protein [Chachezhania sediminis]|uniref:HlyD family secretion protein n=1 Tax=Chachezhania sediminis TaxID=2599291 RepID=UPI00131E0519|nr:HlyD family efflux transporter periplasmic adaptor subunit [Chachezhania sediminis]